ncbi:MAG: hypothetical protein ACK5LL_02660 [Suipraeoptans sp.]
MIKTTSMIMDELKEFKSPEDKLTRLVRSGKYIKIIRGLYETNPNIPGYLLAESIYGPSYLSFEYALSYHGMIPEAVHAYTSATFEKKKKKRYTTPFGTYLYQDVPSQIYTFGVDIVQEGDYYFKIATTEKALCDQLYKLPPVSNYKELNALLLEDLRIDVQNIRKLNTDDIHFYSKHYGSTNIKKLCSLLLRRQL